MESIRIEWSPGCRPEPHPIVDTVRCRTVRLVGHRFHPTLVGPGLDQADFAENTRADDVPCLPVVRSAALPLPRLHDLAARRRCLCHHPAFLDRIGDRLFEVDVPARFDRIHHLPAVPVVRCTDDDRVDVCAFEQLTIVPVDVGPVVSQCR